MEFRYGSLVTSYNVKDSQVKSVQINYSKEKVDTDVLVICLGPTVTSHVKSHF